MENMLEKNELLIEFEKDFAHTEWLLNKDYEYAKKYFELKTEIAKSDLDSETVVLSLLNRFSWLDAFYEKRLKEIAYWVAPKKRAANELVHDENGSLTQESIELLQTAITDKNSEKTLISDTGKTVSFGEKWYQLINSCSFRAVAVDRLTDFISKFIEADGWSKYFVGNIGKNNKRLIQEYHVMDKYNLKHGTTYAAMHLSGDTTKCVLVSVDTATSDGKGEPNGITFLEIGAHTIIDRFIVGSFKSTSGKPITEADPDELAELFNIN